MEQITIDLLPSGIKSTCHASQYDIGRGIRFGLTYNKAAYTLAGTETVAVKIRKPDGTETTEAVTNTASSYVDFYTGRDTCDQSGEYDCELQVSEGETLIGSGNFKMQVEADPYDGAIQIKTASGAVATFETGLPFPLQEAKFTLPYRAAGYTELTHYKATSTPVKDNAPYRLRKAPSGIGNKCIEKLIGASVNFNQLWDNKTGTYTGENFTITGNNDGSFTLVATDTVSTDYGNHTIILHDLIQGHKYLNLSNCNGIEIYFKAINKYEPIFECPSTITGSNVCFTFGNLPAGTYTIKPQLIDLTALFGSSAIADHLYNLETATAGAGVAKFKALGFDAPYYPYTAGQLMSSAPVAKRIIGFNQWDGEWEEGEIKSSDGTNYPSSSYWRSKNYIPILPNTTYYIYSPDGQYPRARFYDSEKNYLGTEDASGNDLIFNRTFTTASNAYFMRFAPETSVSHIVCVNISYESKNGTYEPYKEEMTIYSGEELRGIFELDSNNNIVANGDEDDGSGTGAVKWKRKTFDGTENWIVTSYNGQYRAYTSISDIKSFDGTSDEKTDNVSITNLYPVGTWYEVLTGKSFCGQTGTNVGFGIDALGITTKADWLTWLSNNSLTVEYRLATPTTKSIRTWDNPQPAMAGGTEEFIDGNQFNYYEFTGTEEWTQYDTGFFACNFTAKNNSDGDCEIYQVVIDKSYANSPDNSIQLRGNKILIKDTSCNDTAALISKITGKYLIYEKAAEGPAEMPCGHDTTYADNLKYSKKTFAQIFGGDLDAVTGVLTSKYNSDGTQKTTPEIIQLTPEAIIALLGTNTVWNDAGETEVKYVDLKGAGT